MRTVKRRCEPQERLNGWYDEAVTWGIEKGVIVSGDEKSLEGYLRRIEAEEQQKQHGGGGSSTTLQRWPMVEGDYLPLLIECGVKEQLSPKTDKGKTLSAPSKVKN